MPCDRLDLGNFARVQQRVRGAAERGSNVESDDEFSRKARVTGAGHFHNGGQKGEEVGGRPATREFKCFLRRGHRPFLYIKERAGRYSSQLAQIFSSTDLSLGREPASHPPSRISSFSFFFMLKLISPFVPSPWRKAEDEPSTVSQGRLASPSGPPETPGKETEQEEDTAGSEEVRQLQREIEDLKGRVERQGADIVRLRGEGEKLARERNCREDMIVELKHELVRVHGFYQEEAQRRSQHIRATEERLKKTEELLATRSAELAGAHAFLSTTDHLSEAEVLSIVHDLNENIYQVAVNLTEGWEKLESPQATSRVDVDPGSRPHIPILVQLVRARDPTGLTFLLQSCLCSRIAEMTSSWGHRRELAVLGSIYQRLSASGEHRIFRLCSI